MKTLILIVNLFIASSFLTRAANFSAGGPTNRVVLFATNYLLKLYPKDEKSVRHVTVPELKGYTLKQVAVIKESKIQANSSAFEYVAVYQQQGSSTVRVVLYNDQNQEQIALASVGNVSFESDNAITRIVMQKKDLDGQYCSEALLIPGTLQVAQKG